MSGREGVGPLLEATGVERRFRLPRRRLFERAPVRHALGGIDVTVAAGEAVALIGESGSGKSTFVRIALGLDRPDAGVVRFEGREVDATVGPRSHWLRRATGIVFQDPYTSLDPRMTVADIVAEPLRALGIEGDHAERVAAILDRVGLGRDTARRHPAEFSGGQRQRIALARAIVHGPRLLVGDEPLSALDVVTRAQILDLLAELRAGGMALLLVSHDIGLVQHLCDRVYVMQAGLVVESGPVGRVLGAPRDAYTRRLLEAVPTLPARPETGPDPSGLDGGA